MYEINDINDVLQKLKLVEAPKAPQTIAQPTVDLSKLQGVIGGRSNRQNEMPANPEGWTAADDAASAEFNKKHSLTRGDGSDALGGETDWLSKMTGILNTPKQVDVPAPTAPTAPPADLSKLNGVIGNQIPVPPPIDASMPGSQEYQDYIAQTGGTPPVEPDTKTQLPGTMPLGTMDEAGNNLTNFPRYASDYDREKAMRSRTLSDAAVPRQNWGLEALNGALQVVGKALTGDKTPYQTVQQMKQQGIVDRANRRFAPFEQQHSADEAGAYKAAQMQKDLAMARRYDAQPLLDANKQSAYNLRALTRRPTWDPNNPADIALARNAGLTDAQIAGMQKWDYSRPNTKTIGGDTFQFDKTTGKWAPSGLPADEAKQLQDFEMFSDDENGNQHSEGVYRLTPKEAARMKQQALLQNQRLETMADERAKDRATRKEITETNIGAKKSAEEIKFEHQKALKVDAAKIGRPAVLLKAQQAFIKVYQTAHGKLPTDDEIQNHLKTNVIPLLDQQ